jgi:RNA recognition motif-containing protein
MSGFLLLARCIDLVKEQLKNMGGKLIVGNLSYATTEGDLKTLFTKASQVTSVALITDRISGSSKAFAFVEMSTQAEAEQAISTLNGFNLDNSELRIDIVKKPREGRRRGLIRQSGRNRR